MLDTVGARLHHVRTVLAGGLSQKDLAYLAKLKSTRHIGLIEEGERDNLTSATSTGLCEALGMSLDWFLLGVGEPPTADDVLSALETAKARRAEEESETERAS